MGPAETASHISGAGRRASSTAVLGAENLPRVVRWAERAPGGAPEQAVAVLARGGVVAHPTETVYGLGASAGSARGHRALLDLKGGDSPRAFLLLFDSCERVRERVGEMPPGGQVLASAFWPGPLTLLFPARAGSPPWWSGPDGDVAVRVSPHPFCQSVVRLTNGPVLSTSANLAGEPPYRTAGEIARAFAGRPLELVVDGGPVEGRPSTLLRWTEARGWTVLRPGPVAREDIDAVLEGPA